MSDKAMLRELRTMRHLRHCCIYSGDPSDLSSSDSCNLGIGMKWATAVRELRECSAHLERTRGVASEAYVRNNAKWLRLEELHQQLRANILRFGQFIAVNEEKRSRARRKIAEETVLLANRGERLEEARRHLQLLTDVRVKMDAQARRYRIYEAFLAGVVRAEPARFRSLGDVIQQHAQLMETRRMVTLKRARTMDACDRAHVEYARLVDAVDGELMRLNSRHVDLTLRHGRARSRALLWESVVTLIRDVAAGKAAELACVRATTWTVYSQMCQHEDVADRCADDDFVGQLKHIKQTLEGLKRVVKAAKALS